MSNSKRSLSEFLFMLGLLLVMATFSAIITLGGIWLIVYTVVRAFRFAMGM